MARSFAEQMDRDAEIFVGGPATGFGVAVKNGSVSVTGLVDDRYVDGTDGVQRKVKVLRLVTGAGGTIVIGTELVIGGVTYRVDKIEPVTPDRRFTDYPIAGGAA